MPGTNQPDSLEESLRAMLAAEAQRLQAGDLRPPAVFPPIRPAGRSRLRAVTAMAGAAAATVGLLVGIRHAVTPYAAPATSPAAVATTQGDRAPVSVSFTTRTTRLPKPATLVVPVASVHAADPAVAQRVSQAIQAEVASQISDYQNMIQQARPGWPQPLSLHVTASTATWKDYLTVRFDMVAVIGQDRSESAPGLPTAGYSALVFDTRTGARVLPPQLFRDLGQTAAIVRAALLAAHPGGRVTAEQLQFLSLQPSGAGTTTPLTCYPTEPGLHCLVDDGARTPDFQGRLEATVPWSDLAGEIQPARRP
jgi:hypothetical protein